MDTDDNNVDFESWRSALPGEVQVGDELEVRPGGLWSTGTYNAHRSVLYAAVVIHSRMVQQLARSTPAANSIAAARPNFS